MSIEWHSYWDKESRDLKEYLLVSMQFSLRHLLFLVFYIVVLIGVGKNCINKGIQEGRELESIELRDWRDSDWQLLKQNTDKLKSERTAWESVIKKQREAYNKLYNEYLEAVGEKSINDPEIQFCQPEIIE